MSPSARPAARTMAAVAAGLAVVLTLAVLLILSGSSSSSTGDQPLFRVRDDLRSLATPDGATPRSRTQVFLGCLAADAQEPTAPAARRSWWVPGEPQPVVHGLVGQLTSQGWTVDGAPGQPGPTRLTRRYDDGQRATAVVDTVAGPSEVTPDVPVTEVTVVATVDNAGC